MYCTEVLTITEEFQNDCHKLVEELMKQLPKLSVQDATNVWLFKKLADIEFRLRQLENDKRKG